MRHLTEEYLESIGFHTSWSRDHSYKTQFTKYDFDITRAIILVSQTDLKEHITGEKDTLFDVWFWGQTPAGDYAEVDSHMSISTVEQLETLMSYFRD